MQVVRHSTSHTIAGRRCWQGPTEPGAHTRTDAHAQTRLSTPPHQVRQRCCRRVRVPRTRHTKAQHAPQTPATQATRVHTQPATQTHAQAGSVGSQGPADLAPEHKGPDLQTLNVTGPMMSHTRTARPARAPTPILAAPGNRDGRAGRGPGLGPRGGLRRGLGLGASAVPAPLPHVCLAVSPTAQGLRLPPPPPPHMPALAGGPASANQGRRRPDGRTAAPPPVLQLSSPPPPSAKGERCRKGDPRDARNEEPGDTPPNSPAMWEGVSEEGTLRE